MAFRRTVSTGSDSAGFERGDEFLVLGQFGEMMREDAGRAPAGAIVVRIQSAQAAGAAGTSVCRL